MEEGVRNRFAFGCLSDAAESYLFLDQGVLFFPELTRR
jgi:hypothetical protein